MGDGKEELCDIAEDRFLFFREPRPHEVRKNALVERQEGVIHLLVVLNPPQAGAKKGNAWHILPVFGIDVDDFFLKERFQCKDFRDERALGIHHKKPISSIQGIGNEGLQKPRLAMPRTGADVYVGNTGIKGDVKNFIFLHETRKRIFSAVTKISGKTFKMEKS